MLLAYLLTTFNAAIQIIIDISFKVRLVFWGLNNL